ncbi:MAG TPA: MBOAT family protein [Marinilabiliales bacterium]|nr:MAG: alginate O-acetyltransferase [Bacteroidetes bacterium GWA2_40_14]OFX65150.1 MAG: alginate O-acetyltransferase [Bacteroidetes bacterium GWC2_40_13]OFX74326.1 MAG: alginate O-acetyltransferase [Bacteroidetes bacterium GWD2_40_43]OFX90939.1 MAG: alginate O-acetyltransferase [Bacteroidetes bacterium GWE2_40_63]OFY21153.1 MAG: alginate O-acetyltransferase [Bacteroidetes bacterium GWF2_40_13]OFZ25368.1 MAG: alginate O-acetyltransferase [Bacteroidetes bacterium RIFOXYC2_FULL_40_12]HAM98798.1
MVNKILHFLIDWLPYHPQQPLLFTRPSFWIFFVVVLAVFCLLYKRTFWRNNWLFLTSIFFYYKSSGLFVSLLVLSIAINFLLGNRIAKSHKLLQKRSWVALSVVYNLSWLIYFKYTYFFSGLLNHWFGTHFEVHDWLLLGVNQVWGSHFDASMIILPVGISFYTFQIISYIIDLYRKQVEPIKNIFDFGFYVTFFPQLVAGPIVRASSFVPQMYTGFRLHTDEFGQGLFLILNGLIKKIIIADYISINFVDRVFDNPLSYSGFENLLAVYGYSIQIYCDFSGYTDIAIGLALWMGFRLQINFNSPYRAANITDFWRRWHISLSSWLKDYLYIPLGGNRKGKIRTYVNLFLTMLLGGLWHGANLRFVIWGALHGLYLAVHKLWLSLFPKLEARFRILRMAITFHLVTFTWMAFRARSMESVRQMCDQMVHHFKGSFAWEIIQAYQLVVSLILLAFIVHWLPIKWKDWYRGKFVLLPLWLKITGTVLVIFMLVQFTTAGLQPFIYFQF